MKAMRWRQAIVNPLGSQTIRNKKKWKGMTINSMSVVNKLSLFFYQSHRNIVDKDSIPQIESVLLY